MDASVLAQPVFLNKESEDIPSIPDANCVSQHLSLELPKSASSRQINVFHLQNEPPLR